MLHASCMVKTAVYVHAICNVLDAICSNKEGKCHSVQLIMSENPPVKLFRFFYKRTVQKVFLKF